MDPIDVLADLFAGPGGRAYFGEEVSTATHMLQAGDLAHRTGAPDALIAAALLHDVGHIVGPESMTTDAQHEVRGATYLARWFGPDVCEPVRLHVAAKRYLCAVESAYLETLSAASRHTLQLQGGPMSATEVQAFEQAQHMHAAIAVRRWDEAAKNPRAATPPFVRFQPLLRRLIDAHTAT
jgi:gamma-butyrobetaine dioxygenase